MAPHQTTYIPATPTLTGLPPECRLRVYKFVFANQVNIIEVTSPTTYPFEWPARPAILTVSKQIRREAMEFFKVTLSIISYSTMDRSIINYSSRLSSLMRDSIMKLSIDRKDNYRGEAISKKHFPNLEVLVINSCISNRANLSPFPELLLVLSNESGPQIDIFDIRGRVTKLMNADHRLLARTQTLKNIPQHDRRGFAIHHRLRFHIWQFDHSINPIRTAIMELKYDYDTKQVLDGLDKLNTLEWQPFSPRFLMT